MTDLDALLRAILAHPDEDTVRLAYADELQAQGDDARAEFIRAQVAAATGERLASMELWELLHHSEGWFPEVCKALCIEWNKWGVMHDGTVHYECKHHTNEFFVRRGFVESVTCSGADWSAHGDAILAAHPVRRVTFTDDGPELDMLTIGTDYIGFAFPGREVKRITGSGNVVLAGLSAVIGPEAEPTRTITRLDTLSAAWPSVPPEGWEFPPA